MPVVNFKINLIEGKREDKTGSVNVNTTFRVLSIDKAKRDNGEEYLQAIFNFETKYDPAFGNIKIEGSLEYVHPDLNSMIKKETKKTMEISPEGLVEISNAILRNCILATMDLTRILRLPVPLALPTVKTNEKLEYSLPKKAAA